ncbi:MAG: DUF2528 family protein [Acidovorax sp.]|uniref:DUF2528 family protein n=1 Tax=Acidovorax sp. TaxID=1872122 RepID=UPI0039188AF8
MSNVKTYRVSADWFSDAEITLQVDHDVLTPELATLINDFWSDAADRLQQADGDVVRAVIRLFGAATISFFMGDGGASFGPKAKGDDYWTKAVLEAQHEGWPPLDALGILITAAEVPVVGYEDVTLVAG